MVQVPDFELLINRQKIPAAAKADVRGIHALLDVDAAGYFSLEMSNWDTAGKKITWSDDDLFRPGSEVEIRLGYVSKLKTVIVGAITALEPRFTRRQEPVLTVSGYDYRHRLMRGRKTATYQNVKDSDIAARIAGTASLPVDAVNTNVRLDYVLQHNQTDWEFLQGRASPIGYEVAIEEKKLCFRPRQFNKGPLLTLSRDKDLLDFHARLNVLEQVDRVDVQAWSEDEKSVVTASASAGSERGKMGGAASGPAAGKKALGAATVVLVDHHAATKAEAGALAAAQLNEIALSYITGGGSCRGRTDLRPGIDVNIEGCGRRFSGAYYVTSVTHDFDPASGFRTEFTVRRNADS